MSCLSWNCRGLENPRAKQFLLDLVFQKKPNVLFLCETLCNKASMEGIRAHLGFEGSFVVEARGHSGGLALLWKDASEVVIQGFSFSHIDATIQMIGYSTWRFTGVYGEPKRELRYRTWDLFRSLKHDSSLPWCLMGDMNNLASQFEKKGGRKYPDRLIDGFLGALDDCNLVDLPLVGYPYTWEKGRDIREWIEERLDRALVTHDWMSLFTQLVLLNLEISTSDHCPIFLVFKGNIPSSSHHSFRFENAWLREPLCEQIVESCWGESGITGIQGKILRCGEVLGRWVWDITVLEGIRPTVSREQNKALLEMVSEEEVRNALFQMHPDKSPGPDGMTPAFYQKHWNIVRADVIHFVREFFNSGQFPESINDTHIVLIPKKKNPSQMGDLRPISLCNVLYKITSKVVANRMKNVLNYAISETQSAFVSGRLISDNIMVAFEVMHYLKRKTNGRKGYMALKLDMSKAYDRVEWGFLEATLRVMGFSDRWIGLTLSCVNSVQYQ
ncbi:uncharacterized protein LOC115710455 [Cannabis sativa]|uniref:uncharacterized protein LOC115710455 n=1 Tax=Cannabis sativa TaxID=3483 RepID=UPI0029CA2613|nr:uncharacterized protein LOC115710455 [Cannabis sativa]